MSSHPSLTSNYPQGKAPLGGDLIRVAAWNDDAQVRLAARSMVRLAEIGVQVPPNSRLPKAKEILEKAIRLHVQFGPDDPAMEEWIAEAKRTILELGFIITALENHTGEILKRLSRAIRGPEVPQDGRQDKARETQAELLVAAALAAGGHKVEFAEPDLVVQDLMGSKLGVAIKRISSRRPDQIEKKLREARDQLVDNNLRRIVVINAERYLANIYRENRSADLSAELFCRVKEWLDYVHARDSFLHVAGVAGLSTSIRLVRQTQSFDFRLHFNPVFLVSKESESQALSTKFAELAHRIGEGLRLIAQKVQAQR